MITVTGENNLDCLVYWESAERENDVAVAAERWKGSRAER